MQKLAPQIKSEYERWFKKIGEEDPYSTVTSIGIHDVLRAHFLIADYFYDFGEGIGGVGPRSADLLHSAMSRQNVSLGQKEKWKDPVDKCATLFFGLVKNHSFHDGNKRTAFLTALYQLQKIGRWPEKPTVASPEPRKAFEKLTVRVAGNKLDEYPKFKHFRDTEDPEVNFISEFFKRNTRRVDSRYYVITYNQLNTILTRYKCRLGNPSGNKIDVFKTIKDKNFWGKTIEREVKCAQVGFPSWKTQVGKGAIGEVRRATGLTREKGVDSQAFFHGADQLEALIPIYHGPLKRLADK
jgi:death-on-curing protein